MTPTSVIVIGGTVPKQYHHLPSVLIMVPGETIYEYAIPNCEIYPARDLDDCLLFLRNHYSEHGTIATLGGCLIIADQPIEGTGDTVPEMSIDRSPHGIRAEWAPRIEAKLCELLDDLGNCMLDTWKGARHAILNGERIAHSPSSAELHDAHAGEIALVIGSGPSASDHLDQIPAIRHAVRIFCADTILPGLLARGIVPDYVCAIEREANITQVLAGSSKCAATLIASPVVEPDCIKNWAGNVLFWWSSDDLYRWIAPGIRSMASGRSSGALALAAALHAGCKQIALIGHDLAYRNGSSHAADAHEIAHAAHLKAESEGGTTDPHRQRCMTEANHTGQIETNGLWQRIRGDLEGLIANHPGAQVVNVCGDGGARIAGAPAGRMPWGRLAPALPAVHLPASGIPSPLRRTTSIMVALLEMQDRVKEIGERLSMPGADLDQIAHDLQVSRLVGEVHAPLFHYVTRSLYSTMALRLHLRASAGEPAAEAHRGVLWLLLASLHAVCKRMLKELPC